MKIYKMPDGSTRQYEDGKAPEGAVVLVKTAQVENKSVEPEVKKKGKKK